MDAWSLMRGDAFIHFVSGNRRVNIQLGVLLLIPKSPHTSLSSVAVEYIDCNWIRLPPLNKCPGNDTKPSDGEVTILVL